MNVFFSFIFQRLIRRRSAPAHLIHIYKQMHAADGVEGAKRMKRNLDEHEKTLTTETTKIIDKSDNIITFTAEGSLIRRLNNVSKF